MTFCNNGMNRTRITSTAFHSKLNPNTGKSNKSNQRYASFKLVANMMPHCSTDCCCCRSDAEKQIGEQNPRLSANVQKMNKIHI